jgi:uncharacterized protein (DUF2141 family)
MRARLAVLAILALAPAAHAEEGGTLEVAVTGLKDSAGTVRVAVCTRTEFLQPRCGHDASAPARAGTTVVQVPNVPPGVYAVQAYQDSNNNGRIDRNFFGLPTEGIGFSNDAPMRFGPPRFDDAAVQVGPRGGRISFALRFF